MTTAASKAFGTQFQVGNGASPELFSTLAEVREIDPPEATAKTADVTSHDSVKAEFINAYVDEGELTLSGNWTGSAGQAAAVTANGGASGNFQLCFPDFGQATKTFTALVDDSIVVATLHGMTTGQPFRVSTAGTLPAGLSAGVTYYARYVADDQITAHTTNAGAVANTGKVDITDTGTGVHTLRKGTRLDFAGIWNSAKLSAPMDGAQGVTFKIKVTGAVTWNT